ncbi:hypothetical protein [Corallococcus aberystwythensis]|uniref:Serine protease n=1 Tax=Corallococcus aberystwythensis TaxID=2316722 RepID=A0A3A8PW11_9BACT|nr:hypothetical protein [Corallococcus aberystwythensis]RKH59220.1 hypothetical protein D7W81_27660 [Corallococcus aberystwythensis]
MSASTSRLVRDALSAVQSGRISVAELLRVSLRANPGAKHWLEDALVRTQSQDRRIPWVKRHLHLSEPARVKVLATARRKFLRRKEVVGVSWGVKYTGGLPREADSLIVWVRQKKPPREVRSLIEGPLHVQVGSRRHTVALDVQQLPQGSKQWATSILPAHFTKVRVGGTVGTLSAAFDTGDIYLSGHVAQAEGLPVTVLLPGGRVVPAGFVRRCRNDEEIDGARAGPLPANDIARATRPPVQVRVLKSSEHNIGVRVITLDGERISWINAIDVPADFGLEGTMRSLIRLAGKVTSDGDSGACVLDDAGRLLGFVVGSSKNHTMVIRAERVFHALE